MALLFEIVGAPWDNLLAALAGFFVSVTIIWLFFGILLLIALVVFGIALYEIWTGSNEMNWKLLWTFVIGIFGVFGVIAYYLIGRKERKAKAP